MMLIMMKAQVKTFREDTSTLSIALNNSSILSAGFSWQQEYDQRGLH
jgi:hypothetical protein